MHLRSAALILVAVLVLSAGCGSASGSPSDAEWILMQDTLHGHVGDWLDNEKAENTQGVLNAQTKMVKDCREASSYESGKTHAEQWVRSTCATAGAPFQ